MTTKTNNNDSFLPPDYKISSTSSYMKFKEGKNKFRVLSKAITGWEYWTTDNKPKRSPEGFSSIPSDMKIGRDGFPMLPKEFWAFVVWNYGESKIQILQITQKAVMRFIKDQNDEEEWGNPKKYDIVVKREGTELNTKYTCSAIPPAPIDAKILEALEKTPIRLEALFDGEDPFAKEGAEKKTVSRINAWDKDEQPDIEEMPEVIESKDIPF